MDGGATLLCALLLLAHTGSEAATIAVQSISATNYLVGDNINLTISYNSTKTPSFSWTKDGVTLATWSNGAMDGPADLYVGRLNVTGTGSLLIYNSAKNDSGIYTVTATVVGLTPGTLTLPVTIYDPVTGVSVSQSPAAVYEGAALVNLTCSAVTGGVAYTWTRDGQPLPSNSSYVILDGGQTLQITLPNRTFTGNYTCNVSNPVSSNSTTWQLYVSYTNGLSAGAIAGIVIGSVCGAILLIALIILVIYCVRKRKKGEKEKKLADPHKDALRTVSGTTLSPDDPAFFTMNNIMYRNSSISMGSYIMNSGDNTSDYVRNPSPIPPPSQIKIKKATQV